VALELAHRKASRVALVDTSEQVHAAAQEINTDMGARVAAAYRGDVTLESFRHHVYNELCSEFGVVNICVPCAGVTRDALSVKICRETGKAIMYPIEQFRQVVEINLLAPVYWAMEMVARVAEDRARRGLKRWRPEERVQGTIVFIGSVSSQGNKGQIAYASTKAGLEGAAATLSKEAIFHGVRCGVIHPGFTDTPMVQALGKDFIESNILPATQLGRLIRPQEIADAICFLISNSAVSGELWADAGWHPLPA
jgi:NAD(P)-dependent dehydrogenase (short-subunit alcohol dehydrogenase family)